MQNHGEEKLRHHLRAAHGILCKFLQNLRSAEEQIGSCIPFQRFLPAEKKKTQDIDAADVGIVDDDRSGRNPRQFCQQLRPPLDMRHQAEGGDDIKRIVGKRQMERVAGLIRICPRRQEACQPLAAAVIAAGHGDSVAFFGQRRSKLGMAAADVQHRRARRIIRLEQGKKDLCLHRQKIFSDRACETAGIAL